MSPRASTTTLGFEIVGNVWQFGSQLAVLVECKDK